ncbi:outer membrane beta-barrel protein [Mucilaginibacter corticis]|uniref:outer membrane beta-barrel protein n=1 Tax=Mucilaginibacter corticis TaxID=2597670 RepID=UPI001642B950|nr:outer membrane beta-barrel protein [Mucilaginibacter corticis]
MGSLIDSTKQSLPGSAVKIKTDLGDSSLVSTDVDGKFSFSNIKGSKITLYLSSFGYQGIIKHYSFNNADTGTLVIPPVILKSESKQLKEVVIVGINPVKFSEDTVDYKIAAYPVRANAPVEDVLKKIPGLDVDANGNVTSQGKNVTKVRINGKDYMGGDVQAATKNLPADILESVQVIDDYGDAANLTGIKTGEPNKILNFTIRADKNYGYSLQATAGDGRDMLPGQDDANRYLGTVNFFNFKGDRQITVLGNLNNINTNTFNFGNNGGAPGGRQRGGGGGQGNSSLVSNKDGITNARAIGTNYRDQWGKYLSVYGSYSFSDNSTGTTTTSTTSNSGTNRITTSNKVSTDNPINHRFTFNLEYKPDTINYLKVTPTFSYGSTNSSSVDNELLTTAGVETKKYTTVDFNNSQSPTFGLNALYNHRFPRRHNLSINLNLTTAQTTSYDNPVNTAGTSNVPANQQINTDNRTTTLGANVSYLFPLGKITYLEFNYAFNHSYTSNDKETDTVSNANTLNNYALLSNNYNFTFVTNKFGLNYRVIAPKYNYTLGIGVQPSVLDGQSITTGLHTHSTGFNVIPAANYNYNFSRNESFNLNYNGSSTQPTFLQLQPVTDFSNQLYLTEGNPNLKQQFTNNISARYRAFGLASGNIFFANLSYQSIGNYVASNQITFTNFSKAALQASTDPNLIRYQNTILTRYLNTNGYSNSGLQLFFSKPWQERKYTAGFGVSGNYTIAPAFATSVDSNNVYSPMLKNIAKTLNLSPNARFRVDITNVIDAQAIINYTVAKTNNSLSDQAFNQNTNIRGLTLGLSGKNYFGNWTFSYDYSKQYNYGYDIPVTNPNLLSAYLERRFLKDNMATIRFAVNDIFNQNTGFSTVTTGSNTVQTNTNRLGRYFMLTFALRLQKFAGRPPASPDGGGYGGGDRQRGGRGGNGGGRGNGGGGFGGGGGKGVGGGPQ